jgi:hypothetical protein
MTRARDVADTQDNLGGAVPPFAAGKNRIINGDFGVWQRGTSFTNNNNGYTADRWIQGASTANPTSWTVSQQSFTAGTAPVAGYEGTYFLRSTITTVGTASSVRVMNRIEDVRTFAGQTVTVSFWAKNDTTRNISTAFAQSFGSGGSTTVGTNGDVVSIGTSWTRYTSTIAVPSITGKTIGAGSYLEVRIIQTSVDGSVMDIWGVQVEAGSTATAFQTATGTIQGELAACQRYFYRMGGDLVNDRAFGAGIMVSTTSASHFIQFPVTMRTAPSGSLSAAGTFYLYGGGGAAIPTAVSLARQTTQSASIDATRAATTANLPSYLIALATANAFIDISAEL